MKTLHPALRAHFMCLVTCCMMLAAGTVFSQQPVHSHRRAHDSWRNDYHNLNNRKDDRAVQASILSLRVRRPGELARQLTPEDQQRVTTLILEGVISDADIRVIAELGRRRTILSQGKEVKAYLNVDLENVRYFIDDHESDYLPDNAFRDCKTLRSIVLPYRLRELGRSVFYGCTSLQVVAMPDDLERIGRNAFYGCSSLTDIFIPDYVTDIPDEAFRGCDELSRVSLPDGLLTIGPHAFRATGLTHIDLPGSVHTIGEYAFANTQIATAHIPATVQHCAPTAFTSRQLQAYDVELGHPEYSSTDGVLYSADSHCLIAYPAGRTGSFVVPSFVTQITPGVFRSNLNLTGIEFQCALTDVHDSMFEECAALTRVVLPEGVQSIGKEAFRGCRSLTDVQLPATLRRIGVMAFRACKGLIDIQLPDGLEVIGEEAFDYCTHLQELTVPATVRQIGNKAFYNCDRLMQLTLLAPQPPVAEKLNDNLKKIILRVPTGSSTAYLASPAWGKFKNIQEE